MDEQDFVIVSHSESEADDDSDESSRAEKGPLTPLEKIQDWLSPTEFSADGSEYQKHVQAHVPETGKWIFSSDSYMKWLHSTDLGTLWIKGVPGSGKSVVAANLIKILSETEKVPVLYFFFRNIISMNSKPIFLVRDFLCQLLPHSAQLESGLQRMMETHSDIQKLTFEELWNTLLSALGKIPRLFVVVDALDEIESDQESILGDTLLKITQYNPQSVKLAVTSRPLSYLEKLSEDPQILSLRLSGQFVDKDVEVYVTHRLKWQQQRNLTERDKSAIQEALCRKGHNLFLYTRLMLDELLPSTMPVRDHLEQFPDSLSETYQKVLHEHSVRTGINQNFQVQVLQWITHASRPLRLIELAAVAVSQETFTDIQDAKSAIRICCGPLIEVLENESVQVVHHSFTEFLLDSKRMITSKTGERVEEFPVLSSIEVHKVLASACVDYLLSGTLSMGHTSPRDRYARDKKKDLILRFHFLQYASQNWPYHIDKFNSSDSDLFQKLDVLLRGKSTELETWTELWKPNKPEIRKGQKALHIASSLNLTVYVEHLLKSGANPNSRDAAECTPVMCASEQGNLEALDALLQYQADPQPCDCLGLTPIHLAAMKNHGHIVDRLIRAGADPMAPKTNDEIGKSIDHVWYSPLPESEKQRRLGNLWSSEEKSEAGCTPIQLACETGSPEAVASLMSHLDPITRMTIPLHWAAAQGHSKVLSVLLQSPDVARNIDATDASGNTPLFLASRARKPEAVRVLLESGAGPNVVSGDFARLGEPSLKRRRVDQGTGKTPLHGWSGTHKDCTLEEMKTVAKLLIEAGCEVDARDPNGRTALFSWINQAWYDEGDSDRCESLVTVLLNHGANPRVTDNHGNTPLHLLTGRKSEDRAIRLLLNAGADINAVRALDGRTPLYSAGSNNFDGHDVNRFIKYGADFNKQDHDGNTPLHYSIKNTISKDQLENWLAVCDPTISNRLGEGCLFNVCLQFGGSPQEDIISSLVSKGVDLEQKNVLGRTALLEACANGSDESIEAFVGWGADATATDYMAKTCLHLLVGHVPSHLSSRSRPLQNMLRTIDLLIEAGANIDATDFSGNSVFHDAAGRDGGWVSSSDQILVPLKSLLQLGKATNSSNHEGKTALHIATAKKRDLQLRAENCDAARLDFLLQSNLGIEVSAKDHKGLTALHLASQVSAVTAWRLIRAGADVQVSTVEGCLPLHFAARAGQSNTVGMICQLYRQNSWQVDHKNRKGRTPLHEAARAGNLEAVKFLLESGANPQSRDRRGQTPLHAAAVFDPNLAALKAEENDEKNFASSSSLYGLFGRQRNQNRRRLMLLGELDYGSVQDVIRLLVQAGADPIMLDYSGETAYDVAVAHCCEPAAELLSRYMRQSHNDGTISLDVLTEQWYSFRTKHASEFMKVLPSDHTERNRLLETAVCLGNEAIVEVLLESGADPRAAKDESNWTIVHSVARSGLVSMMRIFCSHLGNVHNFSPPLLHIAVERESSNLEMVNLLLDMGADPNFRHQDGKGTKFGGFPSLRMGHTVMHKLMSGYCWWHATALSVIFKKGGDLEAIDSNKMTCLQLALSQDRHAIGLWSEQCLDVLLAAGAQVNLQDPRTGLTPLNVALESGLGLHVVQKLIDHGADMSLGSQPALISAIRGTDLEAIEAMLKAGANCNGTCVLGKPNMNPLQAVADVWGDKIVGYGQGSEEIPLIMKLLLDYGADVNHLVVSGEHGCTMVFHYICFLNAPITPILVSGADIEVRDGLGRTPLLAASSFCGCVPQGGLDFVALELIDAGADVDAADNLGMTALHHALRSEVDLGQVVDALVHHGASAAHKDCDGYSPLYYAVRRDEEQEDAKVRTISMLLDAGGDPLESSGTGETALHVIAQHMAALGHLDASPVDYTRTTHDGFASLYQRFIDAGCDCDARDEKGDTPIFKYLAQVRDEGKSYNSHSSRSAPLDLSYYKNFLARHTLTAVNEDGDTLLHVVARREEFRPRQADGTALFSLLVELGLDPRMENKAGVSALDVAAMCEKEGILGLFNREDQ